LPEVYDIFTLKDIANINNKIVSYNIVYEGKNKSNACLLEIEV